MKSKKILLIPTIIIVLAVILSLIIVLTSRGGGFYTQIRVGKNGKDFALYKFRSMRKNADKGSLITVGGRDPRITKIGYFIRKFKIDELPQLFNVLKGDMSLVGPRPEVRNYVDLYIKQTYTKKTPKRDNLMRSVYEACKDLHSNIDDVISQYDKL